ncbi:protein-L-isoaspartate(D-aspartate) O-methyltransferase [Frateuria sp. STR12]|uniref:protein-L-isoaspartate(D-aspartate) O-methyltransferase n=1 Tax=Frateuria hangzhouensis TaxID=2995589 RepID=UPI002260E0B6|nr:protein-L-isoaspartate(D-aspartate) O-methyltransferase [Frateuria sp. STR12]MCX7512790.1 protein-L-isoaspartate(D-aspartate) O-methyltransferase [Frateuria sp. STR12]
MADFARQRQRMVERQLAGRGITDARVLEAMGTIPREAFVAGTMHEFAYEDSPLPIEAGQTISQPFIVARMLQAAELDESDSVLEIGAGSGYAAAVMAALAACVHAVERHPELADLARQRFEALGYRNIQLRVGDGSGGWPEAAPFDAILAAAGGPAVPDVLRRQLAIGGRLVMPVGETLHRQRLVKVTRVEEDRFEHEELDEVRFVPLVGSYGWSEQDAAPVPAMEPVAARAPVDGGGLPDLIRAAMEPLPELDDPAFGRLFDRYADARVVLLGEASHGTSEFYRARAAITRRLIEAHGFTIVAVEADWPDAAALDRYVRGRPATRDEPIFQRFPTWMWRNREVARFIDWLRRHNAGRPAEAQAGFYGLDLYSLDSSIRAVLDYLDKVDPRAAQVARHRYGCLMPWSKEPAQYGRMALSAGYALCEKAVVQTLRELLARRMEYAQADGEHFLDAAQNARLVSNAEAYYRAMYYGSAESWNLRDSHMFETLEHLLAAGGPQSKAVVWAHNSHIGDARHTEMGQVREELNLGQLCRQRFGSAAALIGFGTHTGTVAAADDWDEPMKEMDVVPSRQDSYERLFHEAGQPRGLLDLREGVHPDLCRRLAEGRLERFIGVIYRPDTERWSHYVECSLPRQFDGYTWFDETRAVEPLGEEPRTGTADTWPFGL